MQFFSKTKTFKVEPKGVIDIWNFFQDIKIPKSWIKQKPDYIKKTIRTDEVTPSKYPLEEAERDQIAQILKKSKVPGSESPLDVDVESESDKLDYAGAIGTDEDSMFKTPFQTPLALKGAYERNVDIGEIKEPDVPIRFGYSPELEDKSSKVQPDIFQGDSVVKSKSKGKKRLKLKQDEKKRPTHSRAGREYKQTQKMKGEGLRKWTPKLWRL